ncbi:MAG: hypothetical protein A3I05_09715 [Deltaproteobacteria bacterium RIFCSPLOWO2_02_FULL_44_10]|nr:MAG: hypothetical protein A3C46_06495 [Deltaproteobacteria bacterium RIFCSPHIGHO2_02_FULL_44_16]OGQ46475.1 MAG: hypothetical protein A3I05_09715 [Deltaproteobacteria bacterium RIFCSPLOWO2_02_FULL_44_10]
MKELGQMFVVGFSGTKPSDAFLRFLHDENIGGILLYGANVKTPKQILELTEILQDAVRTSLLITVDHEGGNVFRMSKPFTQFPSMSEVAQKTKTHGEHIVAEIGKIMGRELRAVGIHCNFAPVLDVLTNPFNRVIGKRSFGNDPHLVANLGCELMRGLEEEGIMSCGKHFPGHGDTNHDSHETLPSLAHTRKRFEICEFIPFRAAIAAGIPSMMTAHLHIPLLDSENMVTISRQVTTTILRHELGYDGLIFTDDLLMRGIAGMMPIPEATVRSLHAGADMLLFSRDLEIQKKSLAELKNAVAQGRIPEEQLQASLSRIKHVKKRYCHHELERLPLSVIGSSEHREFLTKLS